MNLLVLPIQNKYDSIISIFDVHISIKLCHLQECFLASYFLKDPVSYNHIKDDIVMGAIYTQIYFSQTLNIFTYTQYWYWDSSTTNEKKGLLFLLDKDRVTNRYGIFCKRGSIAHRKFVSDNGSMWNSFYSRCLFCERFQQKKCVKPYSAFSS